MTHRLHLASAAGAGLLAALLWPASAWGQVAVQKVHNLSFGALVPGATLGTVTVTPAGARSKDGGVILFTQTGTVSAALFTVSGGESGATCDLSFSAGAGLTREGGGGTTMTLSGITSSAPENRITLNGSGGHTGFTVGATLNVGAGQTPGSYTATDLSVTVDCPPI
jgi:hypothetical protein